MATANSLNMRHGPTWRVHLARWLCRRGFLRTAAFVLDGTYLETESGRSRAFVDCRFVTSSIPVSPDLVVRNSPLDDL